MAVPETHTLAGRRIVITRAPEQSRELVRRLLERGAEVLLLPMVRFVEPEDTSALDSSIRALSDFEWLIFTSVNAVRFFLNRCRSLGQLPDGHTVKIAAVGDATRDAVEADGMHVDLTPGDFSSAALSIELAGEIAGKQVLWPRSDRASADFPAALRAAGARVTEVIAYCTLGPELNASDEESGFAPSFDEPALQALRAGKVDALTFFSPSAFHNFERLLGPDALSAISATVAFAAVGPVTASAIRQRDLPVAVEASHATAASLVTALEGYFCGPAAQKERSS